ncbi:MAG: hypothetical protein ACLTDM_15280 [Clostridium butyricum]
MTMMLVTKAYDDKHLIVDAEGIKKGLMFSNDFYLLSADAKEKIETDYFVNRDESEEWYYENKSSFLEHLFPSGNDYCSLEGGVYYTEDEINKLIKEYPYYVEGYNNDEIGSTEDINYWEKTSYLEYWDGHNNEQMELEDYMYEVEEVADYIYRENTGHGTLYKEVESGDLYLDHVSYWQGDLGYAEFVTEEELKREYDYEIEEEE